MSCMLNSLRPVSEAMNEGGQMEVKREMIWGVGSCVSCVYYKGAGFYNE